MSEGEILRVSVIGKIASKEMKICKGMALLVLSKRQIIRLLKRYRSDKAQGLISKHRGKVSSNRISEEIKSVAMQLIREHYFDFGPTLASEKLWERHQCKVSKETVRRWMIEAALWKEKRHKKVTVHQQRERRSRFGELIQIDGSPHDWFEGRADKCCLLVFVDDATSCIVGLRFEKSETTAGYFRLAMEYFKRYGFPNALYSDRHGIFRINAKDAESSAQTQFERGMKTLKIELIYANSPQAKGRVERMNQTLQDRLVKELRLRKINDIESANVFLPEFIEDFNKRFAVDAREPVDAHRRCDLSDDDLQNILCHQAYRKLSKNLECSYQNMIYQIKDEGKGRRLQQGLILIRKYLDKRVSLSYQGRELMYTTYQKQKRTSKIASSKNLNRKLDRLIKSDGRVGHKPNDNHPWYGRGVRLPPSPLPALEGIR
jgi:ribosomal protein L21